MDNIEYLQTKCIEKLENISDDAKFLSALDYWLDLLELSKDAIKMIQACDDEEMLQNFLGNADKS